MTGVWKEHVLDELEVDAFELKESLLCLLHTILFTRAPGPVRPVDSSCETCKISYARCGVAEVDRKVEKAIEAFKASLTPAAPELLKGRMLVSFFERKVKRSLFGLMSNEEKVYWEQWIIPVLVNTAPRSVRNDSHSAIERERRQQTAEVALQSNMMRILATVQHIEHIPPGLYEFELDHIDSSEHREAMYSRMMQGSSPPIC